jgi:hypothetical protein
VSAEALFHIPKRYLDSLNNLPGSSKSLLEALLCLRNVLLVHPPPRSLPTFFLQSDSAPLSKQEDGTWKTVNIYKTSSRDTCHIFQGNIYMISWRTGDVRK